MSIITFGVNHKTAPLAIREKLAFTPQMTESALKQLTNHLNINEAVILSTCNRTEITTTATEAKILKEWLVTHHCMQETNITPYCYHHHGIDAVKHLMRVASGMDSMILGEPQILGQVKQAYELSKKSGFIGAQLQQLFPAIFATTKHIRSTTNIGRCPVSVAFAAVQMCKQHFSTLANRNVLLVGAGTTMELVATHLDNCGIQKIFVANRNLERAEQLAQQFQATPLVIGHIPEYLSKIDIIITATASQLPILGKGLFERALAKQPQHSFFIADLAVPRDVEPEVASLDNVTLYNIDDLRGVINDNMQSRQSASKQAEAMIDLYAENYMRQLRINDAGDIIRGYREQISQLRNNELEKAVALLKKGKDPHAVMTNFGRNLIHKIMHQPTVKLRQAAAEGELEMLALAHTLLNNDK